MTYGFMTHSFLNSAEHRQMKKLRHEFTERYLAGEVRFRDPPLPVACPCDEKPYPHLTHSRREKKNDVEWKRARII